MIRRPPRSTRRTHSFPTRRASDLQHVDLAQAALDHVVGSLGAFGFRQQAEFAGVADRAMSSGVAGRPIGVISDQTRSEEHTSELQSLMRISYAVFCLKKKNKDVDVQHNTTHNYIHETAYIS